MAETSGLLNRRRGITPTEGSNPSVSAKANIRRRSPSSEIQLVPSWKGCSLFPEVAAKAEACLDRAGR